MKRLQLVAAAMAMCCLVGTAYAANPSILPIDTPIQCTVSLDTNYWKGYPCIFNVYSDEPNKIPTGKSIATIDWSQGVSTATFNCTGSKYLNIVGTNPTSGKGSCSVKAGLMGNSYACKGGTCYNYWTVCIYGTQDAPNIQPITNFTVSGSQGNNNVNIYNPGGSSWQQGCLVGAPSL